MPRVLSSILDGGHAVDQQENVVAVVAVVGVDAQLADDLEAVLAPVLDVDERVVKRGAVVTGKAVHAAERAGGGEDVGGDDLVEKTLELAVCQLDAIKCLKFFAEVALKRGAVSDVGAVVELQFAKLLDEVFFELAFGRSHDAPPRT